MQKKNLLIIAGTLGIGGIETYIARLCNALKEDVNISILLFSKKRNSNDLISEVSLNSKIFYLSEYSSSKYIEKLDSSYLNIIFPLNHKKLNRDMGKLDYIHCVNSLTNIIGMKIIKYNKDAVITSGIYHSLEYLWSSRFYFRKVQKEFIRNLPAENLISGNMEMSELLSTEYDQKFINMPILPIGIDCSKYSVSYPNKYSKKVITVARLVKFKTYIEHFINIIDSINNLGYDIEYHIYGDGEERNKLEELAKSKKSKIFFHGSINYNLLPEVFENTLLFIGGGSTIIEASSSGIPSIIGIESEKELSSYGFFGELDGLSFNRNDLKIKRYSMQKLVEEILKCSDDEYNHICKKHKNKADEFNIENTKIKFLRIQENAVKFNYRFSSFRYSLSLLSWILLNKLNILNENKYMYDK